MTLGSSSHFGVLLLTPQLYEQTCKMSILAQMSGGLLITMAIPVLPLAAHAQWSRSPSSTSIWSPMGKGNSFAND